VGQGPYAAFNLGDHVGDDVQLVQRRREQLAQALGVQPVWLKQVHGHRVVRLSRDATMPGAVLADGRPVGPAPIEADGAWTTEPDLACTVMVADCLPVLLVGPGGRGVAALHAGWRGLCGAGTEMVGQGVIEQGVARLTHALACGPDQLQAWLGPCIGPEAFEVGADVRAAFDTADQRWFVPHPTSSGKWLADLPALAHARLNRLGVSHVTGGQWCTYTDEARFYSFRRHAITGRQAALIWRGR
jgi:YfiH family protein